MPQAAHDLIFSGFLGAVLAFVASVVATIVLFVSNHRQQRLQKQLQEERIAFDERIAIQLQRSKAELEFKVTQLDAQLRVEADAEIQRFTKLFEHVLASQGIVQGAVESFQGLLQKSLTEENRDFLRSFQSAIAALQRLTREVGRLGHLVSPRDLLIPNRMTKLMLEILLGMRLEKERRGLDDFKQKVSAYERQLERVDHALKMKYQRFLQPRDLQGNGEKRQVALSRALQNRAVAATGTLQ